MTRRNSIARWLLPLALVALLFPLHSHRDDHDRSADRLASHSCEPVPGDPARSLERPHRHDRSHLCFDAHQGVLPPPLSRPVALASLRLVLAVGATSPGRPLKLRPACRGPPPAIG